MPCSFTSRDPEPLLSAVDIEANMLLAAAGQPGCSTHTHTAASCRQAHSLVWATYPSVCHVPPSSACRSPAAVCLRLKASASSCRHPRIGACARSARGRHVAVWAEERFCVCAVGRGWRRRHPVPQAGDCCIMTSLTGGGSTRSTLGRLSSACPQDCTMSWQQRTLHPVSDSPSHAMLRALCVLDRSHSCTTVYRSQQGPGCCGRWLQHCQRC